MAGQLLLHTKYISVKNSARTFLTMNLLRGAAISKSIAKAF
jgi:hypothetical protein